jgi:hypothetical protein
MFYRSHLDKLIYPVIAAVLLVIVSYRPKYHLRPDMPPGFFSEANSTPGQKRGLEKRIAAGYWESAQMDVQWKYPYSHPLPSDPPPEFKIDAPALGPAASDPVTRALYWHRLQQVWYSPQTWNKEYEWDWDWVGDPVASAAQWCRDQAGKIFKLP